MAASYGLQVRVLPRSPHTGRGIRSRIGRPFRGSKKLRTKENGRLRDHLLFCVLEFDVRPRRGAVNPCSKRLPE